MTKRDYGPFIVIFILLTIGLAAKYYRRTHPTEHGSLMGALGGSLFR